MAAEKLNVAGVVPVFNPEEGLADLAAALQYDYSPVVVVDDGSVESVERFSELSRDVVLLRHEANAGKGRAIKTAIAWLRENRPDVKGAVFVDGDGQHRPEDVRAVAEKMLETGDVAFGVRDFSAESTPFRSRFGNVLTSWLVRILLGLRLSDTQTGLRAIPARLFREMLSLPGDRYEYETEMIAMIARSRETLRQVPIKTIYIERNASSHFRPIADSAKVYRALFRFLLSGARAHVSVVLALLGGMFLQSLLFVAGVPCSPWPMWLSFASVAAVLALFNPRCMARFAALTAALTILTAYTFTYTGHDVMSCHFPMQDLLRRGWNPIYVSTVESFAELAQNLSFARNHVLFMPKATALCGALVASATSLFTGDAFLQYAMTIALAFAAFAFSRRFFMLSRALSSLFSFALVFTPRITAIFVGYIDYLVYVEVLLMALSAVLYVKERRSGDLLMFAAALALALVTKPNAMAVGLMAYACSFVFLRSDRRFLEASAAVLVLVAAIGASPYITSSVLYSSPFYPAHSFSSAHPLIDLTPDFTCNADAARMGRLARCGYAWVSQSLTLKACSALYGKADFNPVFDVYSGAGGFGAPFRVLLLLSAVALAFSKKNAATLVCVFLFAMGLAVPVKYIGYGRYFPYMWAIPAIAAFNLVAHPVRRPRRRALRALLCACAIAVPVALAAFSSARALSYFGHCAAVESVRQKSLSELRAVSTKWRVKDCGGNLYSFVRRMKAAGIDCRVGDDAADLPEMSYDWLDLWAFTSSDKAKADRERADEFFVANTPLTIVRFPWLGAFRELLAVKVLRAGD